MLLLLASRRRHCALVAQVASSLVMGAEQSTPRAQHLLQTSEQGASEQSHQPSSGVWGFFDWIRSSTTDGTQVASPAMSPPKPYIPDFHTQHAQRTQSLIKASNQKSWQGKSKMGLDCYSMTQERKFQAHISQTYVGDYLPMQGLSPTIPVETFVQQKMQQNSDAWAEYGRGNFAPLAGTSNVPHDDWRIMQARKATELGANAAHGVRNRYQLSGSVASGLRWLRFEEAAEPSEGAELVNAALKEALEKKVEFTEAEWKAFKVKNLRTDHFVKGEGVYFKPAGILAPKRTPGDFETRFLTETKKIVRGALKRDWVGAKPTINGSIYLDEAKAYKTILSPPKKSEYQGIKSQVGADDLVISAYRDAKASITAAARLEKVPAPNVGPDAYHFQHVRSAEKAKNATGVSSRWPFAGGLSGLSGILSTRRSARQRDSMTHQSESMGQIADPTAHDGVSTAHDGMSTGHDGVLTAHDGVLTSHDAVSTALMSEPAAHDSVSTAHNLTEAITPEDEPTAHDGEPISAAEEYEIFAHEGDPYVMHGIRDGDRVPAVKEEGRDMAGEPLGEDTPSQLQRGGEDQDDQAAFIA